VLIVHRAAAQSLGDANCDGVVDDADVGAAIDAIFASSPECNGADANLDWIVSAADLTATSRQQANDSHSASGPRVQFFGLAGADGGVLDSIGSHNGVPVYARSSGFGVRIVLEGQTGASNVRPGIAVYDPTTGNPAARPDVQVESNRPLGNGSPTICDGGIPPVFPPTFAADQGVTDALNDFSCAGVAATAPSFACTQDEFGSPAFVSSSPFVQFCFQVTRDWIFPTGETILTARLRDLLGNLGPEQRLIVRVAMGPLPATFTATPTRAAASPSVSRTPTPTATLTPTQTPRPTATFTSTATRLATATFTPRSATPTRTATPTMIEPTATGPVRTPTRTPTASRSPVPSTTPSRTASVTPSVTQGIPSNGPIITYLGLTLADDTPMPPTSVSVSGVPTFQLVRGSGFAIVVEGKSLRFPLVGVGCLSFRQSPEGSEAACPTFTGESLLPDLQVVVSQPLGNGSSEVCDTAGLAGGVPAVDPPRFTEQEADAINDLGCRFVDGSGRPESRGAIDSCVSVPPTGNYGFVAADSQVQFCSPKISRTLELPPGETIVTARLRDTDGDVGDPKSLIVRVGN